MKEFKTYEEQIEILRNRKLYVPNGLYPKRILTTESYYNVINGYKDLFIDKSNPAEEFKEGARLIEIIELYKFDEKLRSILLRKILKLETNLRSLISYNFSMKYGNKDYLKVANFESLDGTGASKASIKERKKHINKLIAKMNLTIKKSKKDYIQHYKKKYGFIPLWVLINDITFGTLSKFYNVMYQRDRIIIAKHFGIKESELLMFIKVLAEYRNLCAHDERIYNTRLPQTHLIPDTVWHSNLSVAQNHGNYICGKKDVFALLICLKILLPNKEFRDLYYEISKSLKKLTKSLFSVTIDDVHNRMGLPKNWRQIRNN